MSFLFGRDSYVVLQLSYKIPKRQVTELYKDFSFANSHLSPQNTKYGWPSVEVWILLCYGVCNLAAFVHKTGYFMILTITRANFDYVQ